MNLPHLKYCTLYYHTLSQELPLSVTTTGGLVGTPTEYKTLPWKISLSNLAVSTVSQSLSPLLDPVSLDVSNLAVSTVSQSRFIYYKNHPMSMTYIPDNY